MSAILYIKVQSQEWLVIWHFITLNRHRETGDWKGSRNFVIAVGDKMASAM